MALSNCPDCGKLFNKIAVAICPACADKIEEDFEKVYCYLKECGTAHIDQIHEETGVEKKLIMKFLAEGRFEGISVTYKCDNCGVSISRGKLCAACSSKIAQEIKQMQKNEPAKPQVTNDKEYYTSLDRYKSK